MVLGALERGGGIRLIVEKRRERVGAGHCARPVVSMYDLFHKFAVNNVY